MKLSQILVSLTTNIPNSFLFWFRRLGPTLRTFLSFQPVLITQQPIIMSFNFLILLKVCTVTIKITNHQLLKVNWHDDINTFMKIINRLKLVCRLQNWTKNMLEMLFISYTDISSSFILIVNTTQEKQWKRHFLICSNIYDEVINFWSFWIHEKHKNLSIFRTKCNFFFK